MMSDPHQFSPMLSQEQDSTGMEPILTIHSGRPLSSNLKRLRSILNWLSRWQQPELIRALDHSDMTVRERAIRNLRVAGTSQAVPHLIDLLESEQEESIKFQIIRSLGRIDADHESAPTLLQYVQNTNSVRILAIAILSLGEMAYIPALPLLAELTEHPVPIIRQVTVSALRMMGTRDAIPTIIQAIRDPAPVVRWSAIMWAGELADPRALSALRQCVDDPPEYTFFGKTISECAVEAIEKIQQKT